VNKLLKKNNFLILSSLISIVLLTLVLSKVFFTPMGLVLFMLISRKEEFCYSTKPTIALVIAIVLFVFLGPMGDLFNNRPFPIIQTILHIN